MDITSLQNPKVKQIVKLREEKRQRQLQGRMVVEGFDELKQALESGLLPVTLIKAPELAAQDMEIGRAEMLTVARQVFEKMSYRENPDGWLGVFQIPSFTLEDMRLSQPPLVLVVESVEKPGNLGAILRTADATQVDLVIVCEPKADIWNPNVIRASRGAVFTVPVLESDNRTTLDWLTRKQITTLAATPSATTLYTEINLQTSVAIIVGTEDKGLSEFWMSHADLQVKIPMKGKINSLNVSIATALIAYEAVRQRA